MVGLYPTPQKVRCTKLDIICACATVNTRERCNTRRIVGKDHPVKHRRSPRHTPLPPMPLSELPSLKALLDTPVAAPNDPIKKIAMKKSLSSKRP
jgi:hypothetical protein